MESFIEISVTEDTTNTEKGRFLELLCKEALECMQYEVIQEIRITGIEVDLLARHTIGKNEDILVECKAHRSSLSADVITKLLGNVIVHSCTSGWLMSTGPLSKDAKGLWEDAWKKKSKEEQQKLRVYYPKDIIDLLQKSNTICNYHDIKKRKEENYSDSYYLLITNYGRFWAIPIINKSTGIIDSFELFDGSNGSPVVDNELIDNISKTDTSLKDLKIQRNFVNNISKNDYSVQSDEENQAIVEVPSADSWDDYRPARPQDFVGRDTIINEIFQFIELVKEKKTNTRLLSLKSPSGWGKSSTVVKLMSLAAKTNYKKNVFVYGVDCRAAISTRYPELAFLHCIKKAIESKFINYNKEIQLGSFNDLLNDDTMKELLEVLKTNNKAILIFFDQFEEIFTKQNLFPVFNNFLKLCNSIDSSQENIILGFSWKTDGTIPREHPGYHMWHNISDRRKEFTLGLFSSTDVSKAISKFSKQINEKINPRLIKSLNDHCQGYPWLLKELCIHVYNQIHEGKDQADILGQKLNISQLFDKKIKELSTNENSCIKKIAEDSPAEYFQIHDIYGDEIINSLLNKRILIRSGNKLSLYWDIFKDYILTGNIPYIPLSYIPITQISTYYKALQILINKKKIDINVLTNELSISDGTAENIIRDFIMIGNAKSEKNTIVALQNNTKDASKTISNFCFNHVLFLQIRQDYEPNKDFLFNDFIEITKTKYHDSNFSDKTFKQYSSRMLRWFEEVGAITIDASKIPLISTSNLDNQIILQFEPQGRRGKRQGGNFLGSAPPEKVINCIEEIESGNNKLNILLEQGYRNSIEVLLSVKLISKYIDEISLNVKPSKKNNKWLAELISKEETIIAVINLIKNKSKIKTLDIGNYISEEFGYSNWSIGSRKRYGSALNRWAKWIMEEISL